MPQGRRRRGENGIVGIGQRIDLAYFGSWLFMVYIFTNGRDGKAWRNDFIGVNLLILLSAAVLFYEHDERDDKRSLLTGLFVFEWITTAVFAVASLIHHNWPVFLNP